MARVNIFVAIIFISLYDYRMSDYQRNNYIEAVAPLPSPIFLEWLKDRMSAGESLAQIGRELGVSHACVSRWISGKRKVSATVLLLAERIRSESAGNPRDLPDGLPSSSGDGQRGRS